MPPAVSPHLSRLGSWGRASPSQPFLNRLKALRVIRVVRLIKLMRLLRASRMLRRWETHMSINYASLNLGFACSMYLVSAHWAACMLLLPTTFYDNPVETWLGTYGYCVSEPAAVTAAFESASGDSAQALAAADAFAATLDFVSPVNGTCSFGRGLHGQSDAALALLRDGSCSVRCAAHTDTYAASFFMALQIICGTSGGEFSSHACASPEDLDPWTPGPSARALCLGPVPGPCAWALCVGPVPGPCAWALCLGPVPARFPSRFHHPIRSVGRHPCPKTIHSSMCSLQPSSSRARWCGAT